MRKSLFFGLLCMLVILCGCKKISGGSRNFTYIKNSSSDLYLTGEMYDTYPSIPQKHTEGVLYLSPDKSEVCYMQSKNITCVARGSKQIIVESASKNLSGYLQILKKTNSDFIGLNYILDESGNRLFIYYNENNTSHSNLKRNAFRFMIDLPTFQIHKINGGQTSEPYNIQLINIQGDYLITMDWDGDISHFPNYSIEDYTIGMGYYSYSGTGGIIDPVAMTITYKPFLVKCSKLLGDNPSSKQACDPNNDGTLRRSETGVTESFKPKNQ